MVVLDALVVDDAAERELVQAGHVGRARGVALLAADESRRRLDLADHVRGQEARVRARVGDRLVLLVELLRRRERPPRAEAEERVCMALERGEVVEELRRLALLLLLELRDRAGLPGRLLDDRLGLVLLDPLPAQVAPAVEPLAGRGEAGLDEPVRLGDERPDLQLAADDERERRRLHAAERDGAVEGGAQADGGGARRVHADQPVRFRARAGRLLSSASRLRRGGARRPPRWRPSSWS